MRVSIRGLYRLIWPPAERRQCYSASVPRSHRPPCPRRRLSDGAFTDEGKGRATVVGVNHDLELPMYIVPDLGNVRIGQRGEGEEVGGGGDSILPDLRFNLFCHTP